MHHVPLMDTAVRRHPEVDARARLACAATLSVTERRRSAPLLPPPPLLVARQEDGKLGKRVKKHFSDFRENVEKIVRQEKRERKRERNESTCSFSNIF